MKLSDFGPLLAPRPLVDTPTPRMYPPFIPCAPSVPLLAAAAVLAGCASNNELDNQFTRARFPMTLTPVR